MREDEVTAPAEAQQDGRELALVVGKVVPRRWWPPRDSAARAEGHGPTVGGQDRLTRPPASPAPIPDACDPMYRRAARAAPGPMLPADRRGSADGQKNPLYPAFINANHP